jgi:beta-lactamase superfamily II metal-dependent hydrolase
VAYYVRTVSGYKPRFLVLLAAAIGAGVVWWAAPVAAQPLRSLTVRFMDVGNGSATWITTVDNRTVLVDCGGAQFGSQLVVQLQTAHAGRLSQLAISQPRPELANGCLDVLGAFPVDQVLWNGHQDSSTAWQALWSFLPTAPTPVSAHEAFNWGTDDALGTATATIYNPMNATAPSNDPANDGLVVLIDYGGHRTLLVGPISEETAASVATALPGKVDVMEVGNAGIGGSSSAALLAVAHPDGIVVSYAAQTPPDQETRRRLNSSGAQVWTTADSGTITLTMSDRLSVTSER